MRVLLIGAPGPLPFVGHVRHTRSVGALRLVLAARVAAPDPESGWTRAEALRAALAEVKGTDRYTLAQATWAAFAPFDAQDIVALVATADPEGTVLTGAGLDAVYADGAPLVPPGHPLLAPPGVPARVGFYHEEQPATDYVGVPTGLSWNGRDAERVAGVRRWA